MSSKEQKHSENKASTKQRLPKPAIDNLDIVAQQQIHPAPIIQRARFDPSSLTASDVLQLQRPVGNQAVGRLLARTAQNHSIQKDVVQRRNGATVNNWHTIDITANNGFITHRVGWGSSTGNMDDLDDVRTREEVTWAGACPWAMEVGYQGAGQHHGMGITQGDVGQNTDTHQASQPYFDADNPPLNPGQTMAFAMTQVYQYSTDGGNTWLDIPGSNYTLTRTLRRRRWPRRNQYVYTITKRGTLDADVNHTTRVTVRL